MPTLDATAAAALANHFAPAWLVWLDVTGDPVRVTNFGSDVTFSGTGDSDLDGNTFKSFAGQFLDVGDVTNSESGSDTLTITLSGIVTLDTTLLNAIGTIADWQGRTCRIWIRLYDAPGTTAQGAIIPHYTGKMSSVTINPSAKTQTITLTVENYLAAFNQPSNRSYLNQKDYDSADASAAATLAAANGPKKGGVGLQAGGDPTYAQYCPVVETPVLLANDDRAGASDSTVAIGDAEGRWIWTPDEITGEWGAHFVSRVERAWEPVMRADGYPRATSEHRFRRDDGGWFHMREIGTPDGMAWVAKATVDGAHTYFTPEGDGIRAGGVVSHNMKYASNSDPI
jgi:hypothetical protein